TCAKRFSVDTIIITGDRDSYQLVDETTSVYLTRHGISELEVFNHENFVEKNGITPIQIIDLKACMGDTSDNIPGIPGVGEKTAKALISEYGSLENLYEHTSDLKGKLKEKVESGKELAFISKTLATIDINAPLDLGLEQLVFKFPLPESARKKLVELEFSSILKKDIFSNSVDEVVAFNEIEKDEKSKIKCVILDKIMLGENYFSGDVLSVVFSENISFYNGDTEYCLKIKNDFFSPGITFAEALEFLKPALTSSDRKIILFDRKKLRGMLESLGIDNLALSEDVMLQKYVVDYTQKELSLEEVIERAGFDLTTPAYSQYLLYKKYSDLLVKEQSEKVYRDIELPLCDVLYEMQKAGFKIDMTALNSVSTVYQEKLSLLLAQIKEQAGCDFNVNSPKQLGEVLFERLGLKHGKKTKSGYSTNAEVLESLEDAHPIIPLILKYRQQQKIFSTYIEGFKPLIDKNTGMIHTVFNQAVTSTGRLSSKEPNLQNIPVRDEEGRELRKLFIPSSKDNILVGADYSQIELRLLAHYSNCKPLIDAFNSGEDIHALTASQVFGVELEKVTGEQRRAAKAVNFGIIYGISDYGLAKNLKISPKVAKEYIKAYFERYPEVKDYMDKNISLAHEHGFICTGFNRRRVIPEINSSNFVMRSFGERAAMNMPLQGTAADIIKIAMIEVFNALKVEVPNAKLILQVHDELIVDAPEGEKDKVVKILSDKMQNAVKFAVPLTVNVSCGKTWYEAK
ncbi:MAG: DNA polymerase I, partial [Clostridia bacterium]|nr:DNA polymerase I [Clostridia bacterium]